MKRWSPAGIVTMRMAAKDLVTGFTQQVNTVSIGTYRA